MEPSAVSLLGLNILLSILFSNILNLCYSCSLWKKKFTPIQNNS